MVLALAGDSTTTRFFIGGECSSRPLRGRSPRPPRALVAPEVDGVVIPAVEAPDADAGAGEARVHERVVVTGGGRAPLVLEDDDRGDRPPVHAIGVVVDTLAPLDV